MESDNNQVVWDDLGSGAPVIQGVLHRWRFMLPGLYGWHCPCTQVGTRADGRIYVVGPRPRINPIMTSPNNTSPVSYTLDGSESNVTDWKPYVITKYEWDLNEDGVYSGQPPDQSGPEPTAPISFATPGAHTVGLRVTDNFGSDPMAPGLPRVVDTAVTINVPKVTRPARAATPGRQRPATRPRRRRCFSNTYKKANVKLTVRGKISLSALRKNGLVVKVSGVRNGDVVGAKLTKALKKKKTTQVAARSGARLGHVDHAAIRFKKSALKLLRAKPQGKVDPPRRQGRGLGRLHRHQGQEHQARLSRLPVACDPRALSHVPADSHRVPVALAAFTLIAALMLRPRRPIACGGRSTDRDPARRHARDRGPDQPDADGTHAEMR